MVRFIDNLTDRMFQVSRKACDWSCLLCSTVPEPACAGSASIIDGRWRYHERVESGSAYILANMASYINSIERKCQYRRGCRLHCLYWAKDSQRTRRWGWNSGPQRSPQNPGDHHGDYVQEADQVLLDASCRDRSWAFLKRNSHAVLTVVLLEGIDHSNPAWTRILALLCS